MFVHLGVVLAVSAGTLTSTHAAELNTPQSTTLKWSSGASESIAAMSSPQIKEAISSLSARVDKSHVLVHLAYPIDEQQRHQLGLDGLHLTTALGGTNYFASLDAGANGEALSRSALSSISEISIPEKLHIDLQVGLIHPWMISQFDMQKHGLLGELSNSGTITVDELKANHLNPSVVVIAMIHPDMDRATEAARLAKAFHAQIFSQVKSTNSVVLAIKPDQINGLASDDAVMWVEPPLPPMSVDNAENRVLTGANTLNAIPYSLDGTGVTVLVYDAGQVFAHQDFGSRLTVGPSDTSGIVNHSTHVAGTIGGDGSIVFNNRGMAPGVDIVSYGFEQVGGIHQGFLYTDPGDIEADYTEAISTFGVDIANNSIGTNTAPNGFPCDWTGNYNVTSALIDSIARGSIGGPFRIVWANGNERQSFSCQGDDNGNFGEFYSTAPPACAKNHITVGSVDADTDLTSYFSSWGPTDDGRIKPDISAPGCQAGGDGGVTSTSSSGGYTTMCGTSMATPTTVGISSLILEQYRSTFPDRNDPMNATLKTILANTAVDRGNVGPDYKYGYGSIRGVAAVDAVNAQNVIESEVAQGGTYRGIIIVGAGEPELKVTIAWDDAPAAPGVFNTLVNDLDLKLIDPAGNEFLPWTLDPLNPDGGAVQSTADHLNNIEQVSIMNPTPGAYTVEVTGFNIPVGPTQTFGLTSSTTLINCSSAGIVGVGGNLFPCSGTTTAQVVDCDLNTSDLVVDTVDVMVDSDSQLGGPLMLTLVETAPESATFLGSFSFADTSGSDILVSEGDTLSVTYVDADDGNGNTNVVVVAQASIDCTAPAVVSVTTTNVEPRSATVNVGTDEPSTVTVHYGTSIFALNDSVTSGSFATMHALNLTGLTDQTNYFFAVDVQDQAGNMSSDDNGGSGYIFTTPDVPDFFTEQFTSGLDLEGLSLTLTPSKSVDGYTPTIEPLAGGVLPFEPTAGTSVFLGDDDAQLIQVSGGESVAVYGQSFSSFYVGSNGYVTFGSPDSTYIESFDQHFAFTRVSGLFDDLNPSDLGTVYTQQLADRVVISYDGVTEYSGNNNNTFQIELHFDGTIVISWERLDSGDAIVGISEGVGLSPDFVESDLSTYPLPNTCQADINGDGSLDFFDISSYLIAFNAQDPIADFSGDGSFNFFDISLFLNLFNAGCP